MKELLDLRKKMKAKKPTFKRSDSNRLPFKNKWRKPRGLHNKRRLQKAGHQKNPSKGYRSPSLVRGLHYDGYMIVKINSLKDLQQLDPKKHIAEISAKTGMRTRIKIVEECKTKNIPLANIKDLDKFIKETQEKMESKKKQSEEKEQKKKKSKEEAVKKAEEKKSKEGEEDKQEKIKEEVLKAKPKESEKQKVTETAKSVSYQAKTGHEASSVPGTRQ